MPRIGGAQGRSWPQISEPEIGNLPARQQHKGYHENTSLECYSEDEERMCVPGVPIQEKVHTPERGRGAGSKPLEQLGLTVRGMWFHIKNFAAPARFSGAPTSSIQLMAPKHPTSSREDLPALNVTDQVPNCAGRSRLAVRLR
jgi:hypothetical protein